MGKTAVDMFPLERVQRIKTCLTDSDRKRNGICHEVFYSLSAHTAAVTTGPKKTSPGNVTADVKDRIMKENCCRYMLDCVLTSSSAFLIGTVNREKWRAQRKKRKNIRARTVPRRNDS